MSSLIPNFILATTTAAVRIASFKNVTEVPSVASFEMLSKDPSNGRVLPAVEAVGKWETRRVFQGRGATAFSTAPAARKC